MREREEWKKRKGREEEGKRKKESKERKPMKSKRIHETQEQEAATENLSIAIPIFR